jgi:hypothetical protein
MTRYLPDDMTRADMISVDRPCADAAGWQLLGDTLVVEADAHNERCGT